ncbi:hypothetical protein MIR68_010790 [Amoeboaphelidium protococcarum]|nr:hypothetical protein MIR68_010790 [Amoeboaphelidium protococcarum]
MAATTNKATLGNNQSQSLWWVNGAFIVFVHLVSLVGVYMYPPSTVHRSTLWLTYAVWQIATLGITMGYHRLWSHKAYKASTPLKLLLAFAGTLGFQGSIRWWVMRHRLHHRYTDTENDPYNAKRGFWFSHITWTFQNPQYQLAKMVDMSDLDSDAIVVFQHRYYVPLALTCGIALPTVLAGSLWGDYFGGFLYAGYVSRLLIWHATFCINSFAHMLGDQPFSHDNTSRGNLLLAFVTNGEAHHNFHHEFPQDYRNGINWLDWDPTKWLIAGLSILPLGVGAYDLKQTPDRMIQLARTVTMEKDLLGKSEEDIFDDAKLPLVSKASIKNRECISNCTQWIVIDQCVVDVSEIVKLHPGGETLIEKFMFQDATSAFYGGRFNIHTQNARNWMKTSRIARIATDSE